jgi:hypothetical protein
MARLRGTYDAMNRTQPVAEPPDMLVDAMQTGDRLSYYPETAPQEIAHLHDLLPKTQAAIASIGETFAAHQDSYDVYAKAHQWLPVPIDYDGDDKVRLDAMAQARILIEAAGK